MPERTAREKTLSAREFQVGYLLVQGRSAPETAELLGITTSTVRGLRQRIYRKLGVSHASAAAMKLANLGVYALPHKLRETKEEADYWRRRALAAEQLQEGW